MLDPDDFKNKKGEINWGAYSMEKLKQEEELGKSKKGLDLEKLDIYKEANELADYVWNVVTKWDWFAKKTIGDQWVRSVDSVGANIAEGYGRYFFNEYILFLYYSRGSCFEAMFWMEKAKKRKLVNEEEYKYIKERLERMPKGLNTVIKIIKKEKQKWKGRNY